MIHLGYFAIYLNCAILFAYWLYWKYRSKFSSLTFILIQIILHALLFQTTSKNGLIVWFLNSAVIAFLYIYHRKKIMPVIVGFLVISAGLVITWQTVPYFQDRIYDLRNAFETKDKDSGTSIRRVAWEESAEIIKENVLVGVGTANVKTELHKRFVAKKLDRAAEINLDPHNQYLQSFAEHGILGLLALISLLVYPIYIGIKDKSVLLTLFGFTFLIAASTESIFQTQGGIIYYLLFLSLLLVNRRYLSSSSLFYSRLN
jgi:O-antigen ligase